MIPVGAPPLRNGGVLVDGGEIAAVGPAAGLRRAHAGVPTRDLGDRILLPGLVDAHCHLEWSGGGGAPPAPGFAIWLGRFLTARETLGDVDEGGAGAARGAEACLRAGTTTVADSGPRGAGVAALTEAGLRGRVFLETFGGEGGARGAAAAAAVATALEALDARAGPRVEVGLSPHAPYSVGPAYWAALADDPALAARPWATHLAESAEEWRLLAGGDGPLADALAGHGLSGHRWPGAHGAGPIARLAGQGALRPGLLAAHCVHLADGDPERLARAGVAVAHCPTANAWVAAGRAPLAELRDAGVVIGLGTDSPATGGHYDVRAEARACRLVHGAHGLAPPSAEALVDLATRQGAAALGLGGRVGELRPGTRADLTAVEAAPDGPRDPFEAVLDARSQVTTVIVDGEVLLDDGRRSRTRTGSAGPPGRLC